MQYHLKLEQLVSYSRCRIYRKFLHTLAKDSDIRTNGSSYLFYFVMLCSLANFRTSTTRIDGITYTVSPGEWIIPICELAELLRVKTKRTVLSILDCLQNLHRIDYIVPHHGQYVKYKIQNWEKFNTVIEANAPCQKEDGFFFFPYRMVAEFIGQGKCSEMDIVLDLWLNAVYNDERIAGSDVGPVVYYRNGTHSPLTGYEDLGKRWGVSKSTAGRILRKLEEHGYLNLVSFPGKYGTAIYLCKYLSTMFNISDVTVDKPRSKLRAEVAMALNIKVTIPEKPTENTPAAACQMEESSVSEVQISVPENGFCVPKSHLYGIVRKAAKVLSLQGIPCASCTHVRYRLSLLSHDCKGKTIRTEFLIRCPSGGGGYRFLMDITPQSESVGKQESEVH